MCIRLLHLSSHRSDLILNSSDVHCAPYSESSPPPRFRFAPYPRTPSSELEPGAGGYNRGLRAACFRCAPAANCCVRLFGRALAVCLVPARSSGVLDTNQCTFSFFSFLLSRASIPNEHEQSSYCVQVVPLCASRKSRKFAISACA